MMWLDKRYHSLNYFFRNTLGEKLIKICLDAGFTCPNRDGAKGYGGCIFCSEKGSGDFVSDNGNTISEQIDAGKTLLADKWKSKRYMAYFQAFTNTYAPASRLEEIYTQALGREDIAAVSIATRPDCINAEVVLLLKKLSKVYNKPIFVELGLQTSNSKTSRLINRCFGNAEFEEACKILKDAEINIICHIILGLQFETKADMMESVRYACRNSINGIKLQLLHVLKDTELAKMFYNGDFDTLKFEEYIDIAVCCLEIIPGNIVIHRLTGDGPGKTLISPEWSKDKKKVLNAIDAELKRRDTFQGIYCPQPFFNRGLL